MNYFECCHHCVAPKRYPGCSGKCPDYAEAKAKFNADKQKNQERTATRNYTIEHIAKSKDRVAKRKRDHSPYSNL